jgi:uncharacterized cupin superfamily protein
VSDEPYVANVRDLPWVHSEDFRSACVFEREGDDFPLVGYTLAVLEPGRPSGLYHRENTQEDFLVLRGECLLLLNGEEHRCATGDFVHCPPGAEHVFVGAGDEPCVIFMAGSRRADRELFYPRSELALRHGAGVENATSSAKEAYAPFDHWEPSEPLDLRDLLAE